MRHESEIAERAHRLLGNRGIYAVVPYGRTIKQWCEDFIANYRPEDEAVLLIPGRTDTRWFRLITNGYDQRICAITGRLKFGINKNAAPFPSIAAYFGPNVGAFMACFSEVGNLYQHG